MSLSRRTCQRSLPLHAHFITKQGTQSIWNVEVPHLKVLGQGWRARSENWLFFFSPEDPDLILSDLGPSVIGNNRTICNLRGSDTLSGLCVDQVHTWCTDMHADTHKIDKLIS